MRHVILAVLFSLLATLSPKAAQAFPAGFSEHTNFAFCTEEAPARRLILAREHGRTVAEDALEIIAKENGDDQKPLCRPGELDPDLLTLVELLNLGVIHPFDSGPMQALIVHVTEGEAEYWILWFLDVAYL